MTRDHYFQDINGQANQVARKFENEGIDTEIRDWGAEVLRHHQATMDLVLRGDDGAEEFLLEHIQRERDRLRADPDDLPPGVDPRQEPVCTCGDIGCDLKSGELPRRLRDATELRRGIEKFRREHPGDPLVLTSGREAWSDLRGEAAAVIRFLLAWMTEDHDRPPSSDEVSISVDVPTAEDVGITVDDDATAGARGSAD